MNNVIVITGSAGFLGSALVCHLNRIGREDLFLVDELGRGEKYRNLSGLRFSDYAEKEDFLARLKGNEPLPRLSAVVHLGACSATTEVDGSFLMRNNYEYTRTLAEWCLRHDVRFVYASSAATYGNGEVGYQDDMESVPRLRPLNKYAFSKQAFDLWSFYSGAHERIAGLKFFNVYGPNEYHKGNMRSMVLKAFEQVRDSGKVQLFRSYHPDYGHGEQARDFIYVKDAIAMTAWILDRPEATGLFNIGTGTSRNWNDLARAVFAAMGCEPRIEYIEMPENIRSGYQYSTRAGMLRLKRAGGPEPFYSLEEGVKDYIQNYLMSPDPYLRP